MGFFLSLAGAGSQTGPQAWDKDLSEVRAVCRSVCRSGGGEEGMGQSSGGSRGSRGSQVS